MSTRLLDEAAYTSYVIPGACLDETDAFVRCALDSDDCNDSVYWSPRELENDQDNAGYNCLHIRIDEMPGFGRCLANNGKTLCTNDQFTCENGANDWTNDEECTGSKDISESPEERNTLYAGCHYLPEGIDDAFCVYNPYDCPDDDDPEWEFFEGYHTQEAMGYPCTCEKVMTGACVHNDIHYVCAVSPEACDDDSVFVNVVDMFDVPDMECFLCSETTGSNYDGSLAVQAQPAPVDEEALPRAADGNGGGMGVGVAVVLVLGVLVVAGVVGVWLVKRKRSKGKQTVELSTPTSTLS